METKHNKGHWITINGTHIFIEEGETKEQAFERFIKALAEKEEFTRKSKNITKGIISTAHYLLNKPQKENKNINELIKNEQDQRKIFHELIQKYKNDFSEIISEGKNIIKKQNHNSEEEINELCKNILNKNMALIQKHNNIINNYAEDYINISKLRKNLFESYTVNILHLMKQNLIDRMTETSKLDKQFNADKEKIALMEHNLFNKNLSCFKNSEVKIGAYPNEFESKILDFTKTMSGIVNPKYIPNQEIDFEITLDDRSYYSSIDKKIHISNEANTEIFIHEYMHFLEDHNQELLQNSLAFLKIKTKNDSVENLKTLTNLDYRNNEVTKKDNFFDPYMGKLYLKDNDSSDFTNCYATELMSQGIQYIFTQPLQFFSYDFETFNFIISNIRGEL